MAFNGYRKCTLGILFLTFWLVFSLISYASFIETTVGTAVVNDATASYFNPAALVRVKNTQIIPLGTVSRFRTKFTGQSIVLPVRFIESGTSNTISSYYSPSLYFAMPANNRIILGLAAV